MSSYRKPRVLDEREFDFVEHVISGETPRKAAILAGYSEKTAHVQSSKLMHKEHIINAIAERRKTMTDKLDINRERILRGLIDIFEKETPVLVDGQPLVIDGKLITTKEKASDRVSAAAQINKMQGFYASEKVEHAHSGKISCVVEIPYNGRRIESKEENK